MYERFRTMSLLGQLVTIVVALLALFGIFLAFD